MVERRVSGQSLTGRRTMQGIGAMACCLYAICSHALTPSEEAGALKQLSLEQLMDVEVYSASRHLEPTQAAPNAIFVLTGEDIRRARVTSVPEALRLVPGVQVGRVDANKWAVSMRGFNSREANKLLVLVDGRSIYDPLFSGMLWESQDFMLEDIDRIEVIRGPGGTLWGANAFNGIINIITRNARDTQGGLASATTGTEESYTATLRQGWQTGGNQYARVYAKAFERDTGFREGVDPYDQSRMVRGGFRWDWAAQEGDELQVSGDLFAATTGIREDPTLVQDVEHRGRNVLARWSHGLSAGNDVQAKVYYDHVSYESFGFDQTRTTYDLELQQSVQLGARHFLVWGGGYRRMSDHTSSGLSGFVDVLPLHRLDELVNVFAQDTIELKPEKLHLIGGLKYESTDYADAEWLPNLRLSWTPSGEQTWWASVSDATRVPSRLESDLTFFGTIRPGDGFKAEHVRAFELGHRQLLSPEVWYDLAVFYNDYSDLRSSEGLAIRNLMHGKTSGAELAVRWEPTPVWRMDLAYTFLRMGLGLDPASLNNPGQLGYIEGLLSRHQLSLRSAVTLPGQIELDATARFVDRLASVAFPSYTELDMGLSWQPHPKLECMIVGRNLLHAHHPEQLFAFSASGMYTEIQRDVYGRVVWHF